MEIELDGITLTVVYDYQPAERGFRERKTELPLSPDIPASFDINEVILKGVDIFVWLSKETLERIEEKIRDSTLSGD